MILDPSRVAFLVLCLCGHILQVTRGTDNEHFLNEWAVHIPGCARVAREVAEDHGFKVVRAFQSFPDHYVLKRADTPHRSRRAATHHTRSLADDHRCEDDDDDMYTYFLDDPFVRTTLRGISVGRIGTKRKEYVSMHYVSCECEDDDDDMYTYFLDDPFVRTTLRGISVGRIGTKRKEYVSMHYVSCECEDDDDDMYTYFLDDPFVRTTLRGISVGRIGTKRKEYVSMHYVSCEVVFAEQQQHLVRVKRGVVNEITAREVAARAGYLDDPEFSHEWYINQAVSNTRRRDIAMTDLRVKDVWKMGITGKNISITIIDDGLEKNHPDLINNYDPQASYDLNDNDDDPSPRYEETNENKHGTRCAGVVSMSANNKVCGAGIAFNSKIGGIRMLDGKVNDPLEGDALAFNNQHIDIYSSSWGPTDDGETLDGPRRFSGQALIKGVKEGRGGKGNLYIWASGNGGYNGDCCNADGYASAIQTISVSSSSQDGSVPMYAEKCSSTLTTSYSSGNAMEGKVVSTDLHNQCTTSHSGTSAAAPMVAGILALLLEFNANITWRDAQHILVHTSRMEPLAQVKGWYTNGAGYCVNLAFGFGLVDALGVIQLGDPTTWKGVGEHRICEVEPMNPNDFPRKFKSGEFAEVKFTTDACAGQENEINYLEHVKVVVDAEHQRRGNIYAELKSAMGTVTPVMLERRNDRSRKGLKSWPWISTHNWGEKPQGTWTLRVADRNIFRSSQVNHGNLTRVKLVLYGTKDQPEYQKSNPRNCKLEKKI